MELVMTFLHSMTMAVASFGKFNLGRRFFFMFGVAALVLLVNIQ